jgi:hypothetical protein
MKKTLLCLIAGAMIAFTSSSAYAALAYSFEGGSPPDGFGPNGGGVTVSQDTIGATEGVNSLKASVVAGATFVGALTGNVAPPIGNPPGVKSILFDLTIPAGGEFTGGFAVIGVTIFGASQPDYPGGQLFGLQAQFADFEHIGGKAAGTYPVQIDLASATNQTDFSTGSFNDIFGGFGDGVNVQIPTGFQFFINKSNDAPVTIYIDNVRTVVPEPAPAVMLSIGALVSGLCRRLSRSGP